MIDSSDPTITAMMLLFPLAAGMVIFQANPYYALVTRGILGAVAALIYALLGAADVALTEALVGTMLAITLYAVAVRSSLVMRLGVLQANGQEEDANGEGHGIPQADFVEIIAAFRQIIAPYHLRLELVPYPTLEALTIALQERDVHGICTPLATPPPSCFEAVIRIPRLFRIIQAGLTPTLIQVCRLRLANDSPTLPPTSLALPEESP
ncbi:DUF4040 domain-containing protein [Thermosynechococcaceae cyanobacterium BACA0444]|uniref:DUF4040 domain-containing protein n=1 Tax=Pseudocalidococcus azoricus BACA0444 TaxID=2918990 RepID=A0AAE4FRQ8_9CYAN|nr:DUF4040 domain-containing protein [Pseudocalidococcus azoricus]MDS3860469.1 DUF4040 domain-containing protein [Pseudocalidococcus azoricus BACA0444]